MKHIKKILDEVLEKLKPLDLSEIILFGSYAYGNPKPDSDIDLYIVTKDDYIPSSWREKMSIKLKVTKEIQELQKKYDFDFIVHTKKMRDKFIEKKSSFAKEIMTKGRRIYG